MEKLIKATTAYKIFSGDRQAGKLSHAYMLHFQDAKNLRRALALFALEFFGAEADSPAGKRILGGAFPDLKFYPEEGKKITADAVAEIIEDSAMRPVEGSRKLFVISGFESAAPLLQNKLLKTLEEPLSGIHFLLGATTLAPVLDTVKSRVKTLEIPPFSESEIFGALERSARREINAAAAKSANGILGAAENIAQGGWFEEVARAAEEVCSVTRTGDVGAVAARHGDIKYKQELLDEIQRLCFSALTGGGGAAAVHGKPALIYAIERINAANEELKFNAFFQGLLYDFMLGVIGLDCRARQ